MDFSGERYKWYVSAYQHSANWDSRGNSLKWNYDAEDKTRIMSFEGEENQNNYHSIYGTTGELGLRSADFGGNVDYYKVEVDVASVIDSEILIHEDISSTGVINPNPIPAITQAGFYTFCVTSLVKTKIWGGAASGNNSGSVKMNSGFPSTNRIYNANGSIKILTANPVGNSGNHSVVINSIKLTKMDEDVTTTVEDVLGGEFTYEVDDYNWKQLDVLESNKVPLSLTFSVGDLHDISKRTAGFSKTFSLPASTNNELVLGSMLAVGVQREKISWEKARIVSNGIVVFKGLMRIEQGITGKGGSYKCHIIQDTIDWTQAIGDKELCQVSINQSTPQTKTRDAVIESWSQHKPYNFDRAGAMGSGAKAAEDYFWGIANYGQWHRYTLGADRLSLIHI